jgi:LPS sulfotransferase NodH
MDQKVAVPQKVADAHTACVICTAPRTGSSLLGEALTSAGCVGRPREYFDIHKRNEQNWINQLKIAQGKDYVEKVIAAGTTPNGVFGLKLHWHQIPALSAKFASALGTQPKSPNTALNELLQGRFSAVHYLWLRRRNTVAQGISYYRASRSEIWRVRRIGETRPSAETAVPFDFAEIDRFIKLVEGFDRNWHDFFTGKKIKTLDLIYEDFIADYENTIRAICKYIGVDSDGVSVSPHAFRQQADSLSLEWEREYRQRKAASTADIQNSHPHPLLAEPSTESPPASGRESVNVDKIVSPSSESAKSDSGIVVYDLNPRAGFKLVPASANRSWMDANNAAYRCSPLVAANQHGCFILNPCRIRLFWNGDPSADSLNIEYPENEISRYARSHFGGGIVTFSFSYQFRAPAGVNLYVKGPANMPKDGICPLEGIIEADSTKSTFTMNWKVTRAHHPILFEQNEPIATVFPIFRG